MEQASARMFVDAVLPHGNEQAFLEMAAKLGIRGLLFLYRQGERLPPAPIHPMVRVWQGLYAEGARCASLRRNPLGLTVALAPAKSETILEQGSADAVFSLERASRPDGMHYRFSGLNQVRCAEARGKRVLIGLSLADLLFAQGKRRAVLLGRMAQNIRICGKLGTPMAAASLASSPWGLWPEQEVRSLLIALGAGSRQAEDALFALAARASVVDDTKRGIIRAEGLVSEPLD